MLSTLEKFVISVYQSLLYVFVINIESVSILSLDELIFVISVTWLNIEQEIFICTNNQFTVN